MRNPQALFQGSPRRGGPPSLRGLGSLRGFCSCHRLVARSRGRTETVPEDTELPGYAKEALASLLPADPDELLSEQQKSSLQADLDSLARLRRDAEMASATLRMA